VEWTDSLRGRGVGKEGHLTGGTGEEGRGERGDKSARRAAWAASAWVVGMVRE